MAEAAAGILKGVEYLVEGTLAVAKGIYDPTLPLKATLKPLTGVDVPLFFHSISVVNGRAYLFGGLTTRDVNEAKFANNDLHIVILPSSGVESIDYTKIEGTSEAPPARFGHCAAVIEERIYIFGGTGVGKESNILEEDGRVWVFDTATNKWSHFDPSSNGNRPAARQHASAVASEHPRPAIRRPDEDIMPQQPPDPETMMPEIPNTDTYGTLIVQGGEGSEGQKLNDIWTFDISSRTWAELPAPPPPTSTRAGLAMADNRIYTHSAGQTSYLDIGKGSFDDRYGKGEMGLTPLGPWQSIPPTSSSPDRTYPGERTAAPLIPVTIGQGRNYLLLLGGVASSEHTLEDVWSLQLKPEGMTAASFKDAARLAIKKDTREATWDEVKYCNGEGVLVQEGQEGRGIGIRRGLAAAKGSEVDGASVVVWGGVGPDEKIRGDGLMVTVDI